ncbi:MAG: GntR family transcriptional regulator, partial [Chloroflexota bacterium]|nr:GntR family transcriptional regulator [Chloroflexota bacterium]
MTLDGLSKHERAYAVIRRRILDGAYQPGHRLIIGALADELGVSAVPVREAIRRLEAEGRVVYRHNAGSRVAPVDGRRDLRVGIDVGRTNTDAVLMDGRSVAATVKIPSTADVTASIAAALTEL